MSNFVFFQVLLVTPLEIFLRASYFQTDISGCIVKHAWNPDGRGIRPIDQSNPLMAKFAREKKRELFQNMFVSASMALLFTIGMHFFLSDAFPAIFDLLVAIAVTGAMIVLSIFAGYMA